MAYICLLAEWSKWKQVGRCVNRTRIVKRKCKWVHGCTGKTCWFVIFFLLNIEHFINNLHQEVIFEVHSFVFLFTIF